MADEELLTVDELADALQVPTEQVLRWRLHGGGPPPVDDDPIPRWHAVDVEEWLHERIKTALFRPPPAEGSLT